MTLEPSRSMRSLVKVRAFVRGGVKRWQASCSASRCRFDQTYPTHNGAQMAAAAHRRAKALTKIHGAKETPTT